MKKNMAKGLATALSLTLMASVVAPVGSVFAATPDLAKRYGNVYQGGSYKYTTKNSKGLTVKWTVTGKSKDSIKLASTTGTSNSIKVDTKGKKASTATVEARFYKKVKKNGKNVYQLVKKRIDNVTVKVSAKSVSINNKVESLKVNQEYDFNRTMTPSNATSKTYWAVTTKDGKETQDASVDKNGVFKASKAGEYVVTATSRNSANAKVRGTDSVTFKVVDAVVSARQTKSNSAEVELTSDVKVTKDDFKVFGANNVIFPVKEVKQEGKLVTLEFFGDLKQKDVYTVNYGDSKAEFTATDGVVVDIALNKTTVVAGEESEVKVQFKDANGVVVKEVGLSSTGKEEVKVETTTGYVTGDKLVLYKVGDKATVKATYHTYEYDNTTGKEKGVVERSFEVTAVEKSAVTVKESKYTIVKVNDSAPNWNTSVKVNTQLPKNAEHDMYIYAKGSDDNRIDYDKFESSDINGLTIMSATKNKVTLRGNKTGTFYVLAKDDKGNVVATFPVTVVEEAKLANVILSKDTVNLSNFVADNAKIKVELKDQYGRDFTGDINSKVEILSVPSDVKKEESKVTAKYDGTSFDITSLKDANVGTYKFKFVVNDFTKVITVNVQKPSITSASVRLDRPTTNFDATVDADVKVDDRAYDINVDVVGSNGVKIGVANGQAIDKLGEKGEKDVTATVLAVEVKNSKGHVVAVAGTATAPTTGDAKKSYDLVSPLIDTSKATTNGVITVKAVDNTYKRLLADTYTVTVTYDLEGSVLTKGVKGAKATTTFVVEDKTAQPTFKQTKTKSDVDAVTVVGKTVLDETKENNINLVNDAFEFEFQGEKLAADKIVAVRGFAGAKTVNINEVVVKVPFSDTVSTDVTVKVGRAVEANSNPDTTTPGTDGGSGTENPATTLTSLTVTGGADAKTNKAVTFTIKPNAGYKFKADETVTISATTTDGTKPADVTVTAKADDTQLTGDVTFTKAGTYKVTVTCGNVTSTQELEVKVTDEVVPAEDITASLGTITGGGITGTLASETGTVVFETTGLDDVQDGSVVKDKFTFTGATGTVKVTSANVTTGKLTLELSGLDNDAAKELKMAIAEGSGLKKSGKDVKATEVTIADKRS